MKLFTGYLLLSLTIFGMTSCTGQKERFLTGQVPARSIRYSDRPYPQEFSIKFLHGKNSIAGVTYVIIGEPRWSDKDFI